MLISRRNLLILITIVTLSNFSLNKQAASLTTERKFSNKFATVQDMSASIQNISNIKIKNNRNTDTVVYGTYIRQFSLVTPGQSCSSASTIYPASENNSAGAVVMPVMIKAQKEASFGSNYLYNMIYGANYYVNITIPVSPPGCILPGCTWGSDTTIYNWCIYLGILAPVTISPGYTASVPPYSDTVSAVGYNYNLVSSYVELGPIACDDQTLTCSAATPQSQSFS